MYKKIALTLTFVLAFSMAGLSTPNAAEAWRYWGRRPYVSFYYGQPRSYYYGYNRPYRTYYRSYYGPRVLPPVYNAYYGPGYYYGPIYR